MKERTVVKYRDYKSIGVKISQLGFGCMRLPCDQDRNVRELKAVRLLRKAYREGVNYYDSAYGYHGGQSEVVLGKAVKPFRDEVIISTKNPVRGDDTQDTWRARLDTILERLQTPPDILNFHYLGWTTFRDKVKPKRKGVLAVARKAQAEGLFKHLAFSCHDTPKNMIRILETGEFVGITLQYNLLDRVNEPVMEYARKKGFGIVVMGPVGGGRLAVPSDRLQRLVPGGVKSTPEIAMRFVLANRNVTCAISGMNEMAQLRENLATASMDKPLTAAEKRKVKAALGQIEKLAQLYCTGCGYCMPCPNKVNIPRVFELMNLYRVWGLKELARRQYAAMTNPDRGGLNAEACVECGRCEPLCPQKIPIMEQLKETHQALSE